MARADLKVIDGATGQVQADGEDPLQAVINEQAGQIEDLERDLRSKRMLITKLQRDKERERKAYDRRVEVEAVFDEWARVCVHKRSKLTPDRFDAIRDRLEDGYTPSDFAQAIAGAQFDPFVTQAKNGRAIRHNDIELICRDGKHFESFAVRGPRDSVPSKGSPATR